MTKAAVHEVVSAAGRSYFEFQIAVKPTGMSRDLDTMFGLAGGDAAPMLRLGIARSDLDDQVASLLWRNAPLYVGLALLALVAQTIFARRVVHPIVQMGQAAQSIASGDLASRVKEGANLHNEVGALVRNFNDMAARIDALHTSLEQKVRERTAELQAANAKLEELNRVKSRFLSTVSHELRTPLTSIKAFAQILLDSPIEDQHTRHRFLNIIDTRNRPAHAADFRPIGSSEDRGRRCPLAHGAVRYRRTPSACVCGDDACRRRLESLASMYSGGRAERPSRSGPIATSGNKSDWECTQVLSGWCASVSLSASERYERSWTANVRRDM